MSDNPTFDDPQTRPQDPSTDAPDEVPSEVPSDAIADPGTDPALAGDAPFDPERQDIAENQPGGSTPIPNPDELPDDPDVAEGDPSDPLAPGKEPGEEPSDEQGQEQQENAGTSLDQPSEDVE